MTLYGILAIAFLAIVVYVLTQKKDKKHPAEEHKPVVDPTIIKHDDLVFVPGGQMIRSFPHGAEFFMGRECRTVVRFKLKGTGYFKRGGRGHGGLQLRSYLEGIPNEMFRGIGMIFGTAYPFGIDPLIDQAAIEVWQKGAEPEGFIYVKPETVSPPLEDGVVHEGTIYLTYQNAMWSCYYTLGNYASPVVSFAAADSNIRPEDTTLSAFCFGEGMIEMFDITSEWSLL